MRLEFNQREKEILALLKEGLTNREISQALKIREKTIKWYLTGIYLKSNVRNRTSMIAKLYQEAI